VIEGSESANVTKYGGHVIVKTGAFAQVEGCEFRKMGQKGIVGKYPFHWHMLGPTINQYFKSNSIHHTYNRALTVHGTSYTLVEDIPLRMITLVMATSSKMGASLAIRFLYNLGLVTRMMAQKEATIPTDFTHVSTYWLTRSRQHDPRECCWGGSDFAGFWYALPITPTGASKSQTSIEPIRTPLKEFNDNVGDSNQFSNLAFDGGPDLVTQVLNGGRYAPVNADKSLFVPTISNFTSYKCSDRAIWMRAGRFGLHKH
jgi:cell migration-inducing and hyaluronan-binding protein